MNRQPSTYDFETIDGIVYAAGSLASIVLVTLYITSSIFKRIFYIHHSYLIILGFLIVANYSNAVHKLGVLCDDIQVLIQKDRLSECSEAL